jgi:hypothetical protein
VLRIGAVILLALAPVAVAQYDDHPQHHLRASSHGRHVEATLVSFCTSWDEGNGTTRTLCTDAAPPRDFSRRLPVHRRGTVKLHFGEAPREVFPALYRKGSMDAKALTATGRGTDWVVRLPRRLPRRPDWLGVGVYYEAGGDATFAVGLKRHLHRR